MQFKTHNDMTLDVNGTSLQDEVTATYQELTDLFGAAGPGDDCKTDAEWAILFTDDDTLATLYNYKDGPAYNDGVGDVKAITNWHVGGVSNAAVAKVQIALDLFRETKAEAGKGKPATDFDAKMGEAVDNIKSVMDSIKAQHGEGFMASVEHLMLALKRTELMSMFNRLAIENGVPAEVLMGLSEAHTALDARMTMLIARATKSLDNDKASPLIIEWATKLNKMEDATMKPLVLAELRKAGL